jgi:hypothetical protein
LGSSRACLKAGKIGKGLIMFDFLKPGKGFSLTFNNKVRVEIDFGPMSRSEKINSSQRECDHFPASNNAEIRVYLPGEIKPSETRDYATVEQLADILHEIAHPSHVLHD